MTCSPKAVSGSRGAAAAVERWFAWTRARAIATAASAAFFWFPGAARAVEPPPVLPPIDVKDVECVDQATLTAAVSTQLNGGAIPPRLSFRVSERNGAVLVVVARDGAGDGERELDKSQAPCERRTEIIAVVIALIIQAAPISAMQEKTAAAEPEPPPPAPSAIPILTVAPPVGKSWTSVSHKLRFTALARFAGLIEVLPSAALALGVGADASVSPNVHLRLSGYGTTIVTVPASIGTADVGLVFGRFDTCLTPRDARFRISGCVGVSAGALSATGDGFDPSRSPTVPWTALSAEVEAHLDITSRFGFFLGTTAHLPFVRPQIEVKAADGSVAFARTLAVTGFAVEAGPTVVVW